MAPSQDARRVLRQLGGPFDAKPNGRWDPSHVVQISELNKQWQVVAFRHLIQPFYLILRERKPLFMLCC